MICCCVFFCFLVSEHAGPLGSKVSTLTAWESMSVTSGLPRETSTRTHPPAHVLCGVTFCVLSARGAFCSSCESLAFCAPSVYTRRSLPLLRSCLPSRLLGCARSSHNDRRNCAAITARQSDALGWIEFALDEIFRCNLARFADRSSLMITFLPCKCRWLIKAYHAGFVFVGFPVSA